MKVTQLPKVNIKSLFTYLDKTSSSCQIINFTWYIFYIKCFCGLSIYHNCLRYGNSTLLVLDCDPIKHFIFHVMNIQ